jgi:hypothetical protein
MRGAALALAAALAACHGRETAGSLAGSAAVPDAGTRIDPAARGPAASPSPVVMASVDREAHPAPGFDAVAAVLFGSAGAAGASSVSDLCPASETEEGRVRCLYDERYRGDARAASAAHELLVRFGVVAGVERAHTMDGGYRGRIRIEPAVPTGASRKHLEWVLAAMDDFARFFAELDAYGRAQGASRPEGAPARYRFRPITVRFMRSVNARTPSAYAAGWTVAYNLSGSLFVSADAARETMFHEIFHLNDEAHGGWSERALAAVFDAIVSRCGTRTACLAPYSPNDTKVRGGTFYSFQPGNGVVEYAAELGLRYYREQRAALLRAGAASEASFKCGPPENAVAWALVRDELFDGIDATRPCP